MAGIPNIQNDFPDLYQVIHPFFPIWEALPIGVAITDPKGNILFYNKAQSLIDGLTDKETLGKNVKLVYGPDPGPSLVDACLASKKPVLNYVCVYRTMKGNLVNSACWVFPLVRQEKDKTTKLLGSICYIKEVDKLTEAPVASNVADLPVIKGENVGYTNLVSKNPKMMEAIETAKHAAVTPSPVLLFGKTGTGKDLFARNIHCTSLNRDNPFVTLNCAAIPETLLESLLFGTTKGAFTGAMDKPGLFEQANGGTLFLDETDSMPLTLQPKLLRVLQDKKIRRMGSEKEIQLSLKIISAMSRDPLEAVQSGKLRSDLFYRLGVVVIGIPPLKERPEDIDDLCTYFILKYNTLLGKKVRSVSPDLLAMFKQYNWPGNVRELEHLIEASMNVTHDTEILDPQTVPEYFLKNLRTGALEAGLPGPAGIQAGVRLAPQSRDFQIERPAVSTRECQPDPVFFQPADPTQQHQTPVPEYMPPPIPGMNPAGMSLPTLAEMAAPAKQDEKSVIVTALTRTFGNITQAAGVLGVSRQNLSYKMKKYGLHRQDFRKV
ncbi:MAG: sigma 54-interacting transcriptional regulator [Desulfobacterales bacterium]|nr:sigma 54-interacting transcriptional regulator [Desulfobacterales bacterium]